MTLRDYLSEISPQFGPSSSYQRGRSNDRRTDEWAFQYINIVYLQPIMEAFDDDGTGYITISEINKFVSMLPRSINWRYVFDYVLEVISIHVDVVYRTGSHTGP